MYQPWKFLIYIAADNLLYENAQVSLREITDSSLLGDVEIIAQIDGPTAAMSTRYKCEKGSKRLIWVAPENYIADRGDRLRDFLNAAAGNINAHQRILLVLWGEGNGLDHIYFYGDPKDSRTAEPEARNANRYVKDIELGSILLEFTQKLGRRIDVLGFDACKMAMAEVCYEVRESVSIVVGSDEQVPKESWPYERLLQDLARFPGMNANTLSTLIVSRYVEKYKVPGKTDRVSLSAMNLSGSDELGAARRDAWCRRSNAVAGDLPGKRRIFRARDASRTADDTSYIDFGVFCEELMESFDEHTPVHASAKSVLFALKNHAYIQYHRYTGEDRSFIPYGLSLYFPQALPPDACGPDAPQAEFTFATHEALAGMKDPPHSKKDPPHSKKDPPHSKKSPRGAGQAPMEITSYYVLWNSYVPLEFNQVTGWADFLARVLADGSDQEGVPV